jgi:hypothetical protein
MYTCTPGCTAGELDASELAAGALEAAGLLCASLGAVVSFGSAAGFWEGVADGDGDGAAGVLAPDVALAGAGLAGFSV